MIDREDLPEAFKAHLKTNRGCLPAAVGGFALLAATPLVGLIRIWQGWRRGESWIVERTTEAAALPGRSRVVVEADVPNRSAAGFPRRMTDAVVRVAEHLRQMDDAYHHIARIPTEPEAMVLPLGPQIQALGERIVLAMGHGEFVGRTALWLTLPATSAISEHIDSFGFDPDGRGEPEATIERVQPRWAMTTSKLHQGPSVVHRLVFWIPETEAPRVETILSRLAI